MTKECHLRQLEEQLLQLPPTERDTPLPPLRSTLFPEQNTLFLRRRTPSPSETSALQQEDAQYGILILIFHIWSIQ
jgi:hypothetical protein